MQYVVTIIGCGRIGSAIGRILERNGHHVSYWDAQPGKRTKGATIGELISTSRAVFICAPSPALAAITQEIAPFVTKNTTIFTLTKGIEPRTHLFSDQFIKKMLPEVSVGIVGGPMMAEEIIHRGGCIDLGTASDRVARLAHQLFLDSPVLVERNYDPHGTAIVGVLKNIYSCGFGMILALKWNQNQQGWFLSRATNEMARITELLGGDGMTAYGTAGLGDFIATALSPHSSNRRAGTLLAKGKTCPPEEGLTSLPVLLKLLGKHRADFPLLETIAQAVRR